MSVAVAEPGMKPRRHSERMSRVPLFPMPLWLMPLLALAGCTAAPRADPGQQSLQNAFVAVVEGGDQALVERFLRAEPALASASRAGVFADPRKPLSAAVAKGNEALARLLLARGARADDAGVDEQGRPAPSALHYAAQARQPALVKLLLEKGAHPDARSPWGATPLHEAARRGSAEVVELLIKAGASPGAEDERGRTPLHTAAEGADDLAGAAYLCAIGTSLDQRDKDGRTPLAVAEADAASLRSSGAPAAQVAARERAAAFLRPGQGCQQLWARVHAGRPATRAEAELTAREAACLSGDAWACGNAGAALDDGKDVPEDDTRARSLFERGCRLGNGFSCGREGWFYITGTGVARDDARGVQLYGRACDLGEEFSCARLGEWYLAGQRVPRDPARARELLKKGCDGGDQKGCAALRSLGGAS